MAFACLLKWENNEDWQARKTKNRPEPHPTSLDPKLARACVNLLNTKKGDTVVDPFCGSGGLLIEAGLVGAKVIGFDINDILLRKAEINLKHYGIKNYQLKNKNALDIKKYKYIITDLPYGRSTSHHGLEELYEDFFSVLDKKLIKKAVVMLPSNIKVKTNLKTIHEFRHYLHKGLTKRILVLERQDL